MKFSDDKSPRFLTLFVKTLYSSFCDCISYSTVIIINHQEYLIAHYALIPGVVNGTLFALLEIVRRFTWNFFRLENEHLNNCGEFRAVRDISLAPLSQNHLQALEDLMDMNHSDLDSINRKTKID